jgi:hypothetical protein
VLSAGKKSHKGNRLGGADYQSASSGKGGQMDKIEKNCGNCLYYNYQGKRGLAVAECEVYSAMHTAVDKACPNWKEEQHVLRNR